jgi:hypothetical protein
MYLQEPVSRPGGRALLIPAFVCAGLSVVLIRAGFFSLLFPVPLGFCAVVFGSTAGWLCFVISSLANGVVAVGVSLHSGAGLLGARWDILYCTVLALGFTWIMAGNPPENSGVPRIPKIRTVYRFTVAAALGAAVFIAVIFAAINNERFLDSVSSQASAISPFFMGNGNDVAQQLVLEAIYTPEKTMQTFASIMLRGGALILLFFLLFFCRWTAFILSRLFLFSFQGTLVPRHYTASVSGDLAGFHAPRRIIWLFSLSLPAVLLCRAVSLGIIEIAAWNLLFLCVMMYLAQGVGIIIFALTRRSLPRILRPVFSILLILAFFIQGINVFVMGALVLLGIAENWVPLRVVTNEK